MPVSATFLLQHGNLLLFKPIANHYNSRMKIHQLAAVSILPLLIVSCASKQDGGYDTTGTYDTPDYGTPDGAPLQPVDPVNPVYDSPAAYEDTAPVSPSTPSTPSEPAGSAAVHTVVKGDTLWGLSRKYNVSIDAIKQANSMTRDTVVLGQKLTIPAR